jgi:LysM repeat protein
LTDSRFVTLRTAKPPLSVTAIIGASPPVPAGGYGGWALIARARRKALTEWQGIEPLRVVVPLILGVKPGARGAVVDNAALGVSTVLDSETLERMAQPPTPRARSRRSSPPSGRCRTRTAVRWVIESFDWDANPLYSSSGFLVRQAVTVHLLEYVRDTDLADINAAAVTRKKALAASSSATKKAGGSTNQAPKSKVYIVKPGDTLSSIAARVLGNYKRYTEIAAASGISIGAVLHAGQQAEAPVSLIEPYLRAPEKLQPSRLTTQTEAMDDNLDIAQINLTVHGQRGRYGSGTRSPPRRSPAPSRAPRRSR